MLDRYLAVKTAVNVTIVELQLHFIPLTPQECTQLFDTTTKASDRLCKTTYAAAFAFANGLRSSMLNRDFSFLRNDPKLAVATLLDPRFKTFGFGNNFSSGEEARQLLYRAAASIARPEQAEVVERVTTNGIWEELEHRKALAHVELQPTIEARIEVDMYLKDDPLPMTSDASIKSDPLSWWQSRRTRYEDEGNSERVGS